MTRNRYEKRAHTLKIGVSPAELERIDKEYKNTTFRSRSDFLRCRIFGEPETVLYRNQSLDEFLPIAIPIKKDLTDIVGTLREKLSRFSTSDGINDLVTVAPELQSGLTLLNNKVEEIRTKLIQIYERCA